MDIFKSKAEEVVVQSLRDDWVKREEARQDRAFDKIAMLTDNFKNQVSDLLRSYVSDGTWSDPLTQKGLKQYASDGLNFFKAIIWELSMIYKKDPVRIFGDEGISEKIQQIYNDARIDQKLKRANEFLNAVNDLALHVVPRKGKIDIDIYPPSMLMVSTEDENPTVPEYVFLKKMIDPTLDTYTGNTYYTVWSKDHHYNLKLHDKLWIAEPVGDNEDMKNPFGVLPFVFLHRTIPDSFWNETEGSDLYKMTLIVNALWSLKNSNFVWHNFKQLAIATDQPDRVPDGVTRSPDTAVIIPADGSIQMLDYQINLGALRDDLLDSAGIVSSIYGVDLQTLLAVSNESGIKLKLKQSRLEEFRDDQIKVFETAEQELFELIKIVSDKAGLGTIKGELQITFAPMDIFTDPVEELRITEKELFLNLRSIVDIYIERNPTYSRDEAIKKLTEIHQDNNKFRNMVDQNLMDRLNETGSDLSQTAE